MPWSHHEPIILQPSSPKALLWPLRLEPKTLWLNPDRNADFLWLLSAVFLQPDGPRRRVSWRATTAASEPPLLPVRARPAQQKVGAARTFVGSHNQHSWIKVHFSQSKGFCWSCLRRVAWWRGDRRWWWLQPSQVRPPARTAHTQHFAAVIQKHFPSYGKLILGC